MANPILSQIQVGSTTYDIADSTARSGDATKAPLASPTFTGTPKAPTATAGTNTTQIATTAFVQTAVAEARMLVVNVTASSNTSVTVTNSKITASHVPLQIPIVGADVDVTVTTAAGQATIECTAGIPAFTMYLVIPQ